MSTATAADESKTIALKAESDVNSRFGIVCTTDELLHVPMGMYQENRRRVLDRLSTAGLPANSIILMQGGESPTFFDTDHEPLFKQESNFHYLFGVREPDFYGTIDVDTGKSMLFAPRLPEEYATWMGKIRSTDETKKMYEVDEVHYVDELKRVLTEQAPGRLLTLFGQNTDSFIYAKPATFAGISEFDAPQDTTLFDAIVECRVIKSEKEQEVMRFMNIISSEAHMAVMRCCAPGLFEYQMESLFQHWCYYHGGSRCMSYTCICGSGNNGATLHYGHAGAPPTKRMADGDMCLFDMGGEYFRYGSDITCSFPANGKFTDRQKFIYNTVLDATWSVEAVMKEGVPWPSMQTLAYRVMLTRLKAGGLLVGDVDLMLEADLGAVFMPCGLGHFLGIDTHDVGGYPAGAKRIDRPGYRSLRTVRALKAGMVITIEPGIYFNEYNLRKAFERPEQAPFLVKEAIDSFAGFGGVRIEDNVIVRKNNCELMTHVPRYVEEVEAVMAGTITSREKVFKPTFVAGQNKPYVPEVTYRYTPSTSAGATATAAAAGSS